MTDTTAATMPKTDGKCAKLHALWTKAGEGKLLPRAFAIELAIAEGANPSTARTQYQRYFERMRSTDSLELPLE